MLEDLEHPFKIIDLRVTSSNLNSTLRPCLKCLWASHWTLNAPNWAGRALHGSSHPMVSKCMGGGVNRRTLRSTSYDRESAEQSIPFTITSYICDMHIIYFFMRFTMKLYSTSNLSSSGSLVEPLHIPLLTDIKGCVHKHLKERQPSSFVDLSGIKTILMLRKTRTCS